MEFFGESLVSALRNDALLIEDSPHARLGGLEHLDEVLVVLKNDLVSLDAFSNVRSDGLLKYSLGKKSLQLLVSEIDAELLE